MDEMTGNTQSRFAKALRWVLVVGMLAGLHVATFLGGVRYARHRAVAEVYRIEEERNKETLKRLKDIERSIRALSYNVDDIKTEVDAVSDKLTP